MGYIAKFSSMQSYCTRLSMCLTFLGRLTEDSSVGVCDGMPEGGDDKDGTNDGVAVGESDGESCGWE